jgi:hypothetical protein
MSMKIRPMESNLPNVSLRFALWHKFNFHLSILSFAAKISARWHHCHQQAQSQRDYTIRGQSFVWRHPTYWPPTPPPLVQGEDTLAEWKRGGGSIFWKTLDTALYSTYVSTLCAQCYSISAVLLYSNSHWSAFLISRNHSITQLISFPKKVKNDYGQRLMAPQSTYKCRVQSCVWRLPK